MCVVCCALSCARWNWAFWTTARDGRPRTWAAASGPKTARCCGCASAQNLPRASFTILSGVFLGHALHLDATVASASAKLDSSPTDLLASRAPALSRRRAPVRTRRPAGGTRAQVAAHLAEFPAFGPGRREGRAGRDVRVGLARLLGPFPAEGRPIGNSSIGPATTAFLLPDGLEHFDEDFGQSPWYRHLLAPPASPAALPIASIEVDDAQMIITFAVLGLLLAAIALVTIVAPATNRAGCASAASRIDPERPPRRSSRRARRSTARSRWWFASGRRRRR